MSGWEGIVDLQDEALRFWMSEVGQRYGIAFGKSMIQSIMHDQGIHERAEAAGWDKRDALDDTQWLLHLHELEAKKFMMAEPIFVNMEVKQLIDAAWPQFQEEKLRIEDVFPTLYGFMVFPESFTVKDTHDRDLAFRALAWMPIDRNSQPPQRMRGISPQDTGGIFLTAYSHKDDPDDYPLTREHLGGHRVPTLSLCHVSPWHIDNAPPIDVNGAGLNDMLKIMQVSWRLARQTITTDEPVTLPKAFRKRAARGGLPTDVTLIRLRHAKPAQKPEGVTEIEWQSRWIVRGHWHTYHYKDGESRQLWVGDYIKGPEDKPLRIKPLRAFEFVR